MKYLVDNSSHRINLEAWLDEDEGVWLEPGVVCWNPCILCKKGEENKIGYSVEDIPEDKVLKPLLLSDEDLYWTNGKVLTLNQV